MPFLDMSQSSAVMAIGFSTTGAFTYVSRCYVGSISVASLPPSLSPNTTASVTLLAPPEPFVFPSSEKSDNSEQQAASSTGQDAPSKDEPTSATPSEPTPTPEEDVPRIELTKEQVENIELKIETYSLLARPRYTQVRLGDVHPAASLGFYNFFASSHQKPLYLHQVCWHSTFYCKDG